MLIWPHSTVHVVVLNSRSQRQSKMSLTRSISVSNDPGILPICDAMTAVGESTSSADAPPASCHSVLEQAMSGIECSYESIKLHD
jgi:hypothetical protein